MRLQPQTAELASLAIRFGPPLVDSGMAGVTDRRGELYGYRLRWLDENRISEPERSFMLEVLERYDGERASAFSTAYVERNKKPGASDDG